MSAFKLPADPNYGKFQYTIFIDDANYVFKFRFNHRLNQWIWSICDENSVEIIANIPLLSNTSLVQPYYSYNIPKSFFSCYDTRQLQRNPDRDNLGLEVVFIRDDLQ